MPNLNDLIVIFSSFNLTEVHLVQIFLEDLGYQSTIRGEHRVALAGEVPMDDARIELLVQSTDADLVDTLIRSHRSRKVVDWLCGACHELNPGNFEHCWQCGHLIAQHK